MPSKNHTTAQDLRSGSSGEEQAAVCVVVIRDLSPAGSRLKSPPISEYAHQTRRALARRASITARSERRCGDAGGGTSHNPRTTAIRGCRLSIRSRNANPCPDAYAASLTTGTSARADLYWDLRTSPPNKWCSSFARRATLARNRQGDAVLGFTRKGLALPISLSFASAYGLSSGSCRALGVAFRARCGSRRRIDAKVRGGRKAGPLGRRRQSCAFGAVGMRRFRRIGLSAGGSCGDG
jgi:hypothetical protein